MNERNRFTHFGFAIVLTVLQSMSPSLSVAEQIDFSLPNLDGTTFIFQEEVKDRQLVLFDFWATWCEPCLKSLPAMEKIAADYAERGVTVYTVNADVPEDHDKIRPFMEKHKLELPVLLDSTFQLMRGLQMSGVPSTAIFSAEGLLHKEQGYGAGSDKTQRHRLDDLLTRFGPQSSVPVK